MYPDKEELKIIDAAIAEAKADPVKARPALVNAFNAGDITVDRIDSYLVVLKEKQPDLWGATLDPVQATKDAETAALASAAFVGRSIASRGALVKAVGEAEAGRLAKLHGLVGLADFKTVGVAPVIADDDEGDDDEADKAKSKAKNKDGDKDKPSSNPWSQNYKGSNPADAERIRIIKTLGTKAAASMATSAGADLAGRPLRSRVA
jgi:hypothetical protein